VAERIDFATAIISPSMMDRMCMALPSLMPILLGSSVQFEIELQPTSRGWLFEERSCLRGSRHSPRLALQTPDLVSANRLEVAPNIAALRGHREKMLDDALRYLMIEMRNCASHSPRDRIIATEIADTISDDDADFASRPWG
jgi:hypothetical protein